MRIFPALWLYAYSLIDIMTYNSQQYVLLVYTHSVILVI